MSGHQSAQVYLLGLCWELGLGVGMQVGTGIGGGFLLDLSYLFGVWVSFPCFWAGGL